MRMYSYDQVLTDVKDVYEQLTGLPAPEINIKKPRYPLPKGINPVALVQSEINQLNMCLINSGVSWRLSKSPAWAPPAEVYETQDAYVVNLELPGLGQEDVKVTQTNNILTVRGARRFKKANERPSITVQSETTERSSDSFRCRAMSYRRESKINLPMGFFRSPFQRPRLTCQEDRKISPVSLSERRQINGLGCSGAKPNQ